MKIVKFKYLSIYLSLFIYHSSNTHRNQFVSLFEDVFSTSSSIYESI